ncbi:hypothetical protein [Paenibacillus wenxiniae]|uniref:Uncharacterized protein n=1 Tax=Paenibacillus wenxiniae TaxID=1636843 RepID=A0ABW4RIZ8_9BACL
MEVNLISISAIITEIETAAATGQLTDIERFINMLDVSDQLELHSHLSMNTLQIIKNHRHELTISDAVKEHMLWYYLSQQEWSDDVLAETIAIYIESSFIAMESIVIVALKQNRVTEQQVQRIRQAFASKEVTRQIEQWRERFT